MWRCYLHLWWYFYIWLILDFSIFSHYSTSTGMLQRKLYHRLPKNWEQNWNIRKGQKFGLANKKDWCILRECWTWPFWLQMHHSWSTLCRSVTSLIPLQLFSTKSNRSCLFYLFVKVGEAHQYYTEMVALVVTSIVLQVSSKYCRANYLVCW